MKLKIDDLVNIIYQEINALSFPPEHDGLYEPVRYIMQLPGKRIRPLLSLLSYSLFKSDPSEIVKPALAVEVFHNFTLVHDDLMDKAPLRRGEMTVHEKWNNSTAVLSGDVMLVKAYDLILSSETGNLKDIIAAFNLCAAEVCEGQQLDMLFEARQNVTEKEYLEMIRLKTSVLLGFAFELGGLLAETDKKNIDLLRIFGEKIGIGFQLTDDLLDVYADQGKFGKQVGGDIISNKKTYLLIKAMELSDPITKRQILDWLTKKEFDKEEKIQAVKGFYDKLNIKDITQRKVEEYFMMGFDAFEKIDVAEDRKEPIRAFVNQLIQREK